MRSWMTIVLLLAGSSAMPLHAQHTRSAVRTFAPTRPVTSRHAAITPDSQRSPAAVYRMACASCHGPDGGGMPESQVGFDVPLPDFGDCSFATREPDSDWYAVTHDGGPARGFDRMMPAFGDVLTDAEIEAAVAHLRTFCDDRAWPRGELNLPRPLVTEKAFPEDEAVVEGGAALEGRPAYRAQLVFERRFRARNQFEIVIPFRVDRDEPGRWRGGLGDIAVAVKRAVHHSVDRGTIVSIAGEVILPTGDIDDGDGSGVFAFEPFLLVGQILPRDAFVHAQAGGRLSADTDRLPREAFARGAAGMSFTEGRFGRTWSPMLELLVAREAVAGAHVEWDVVPQMQVTLNTRQHVMMNAGVRIPLSDAGPRRTELLVYLLWDWFDGPFLAGW